MKQPDVNKLAEHYSAILRELGADLHAEKACARRRCAQRVFCCGWKEDEGIKARSSPQ
jgi:hypothetical protein